MADWRPLGYTDQGIPINHWVGHNQPRLLIVHIMQGSLGGTDAWFRDPGTQASAHFGVGRKGKIIQWLDTADRAWHAVDANGYSIGVEHEGFSGEPLSDNQIETTGHLYAWLTLMYPDIELWINTRPFSGSGLSWHGLGGMLWGNHPQCPGAPIVHQLPDILDVAHAARHMLASEQLTNPPAGSTQAVPASLEQLPSRAPESDSSSTGGNSGPFNSSTTERPSIAGTSPTQSPMSESGGSETNPGINWR